MLHTAYENTAFGLLVVISVVEILFESQHHIKELETVKSKTNKQMNGKT